MKIKKIISQLVVLALALAQLSIAQAQTENTYYVPDAAGSPIAATDQAGNVKWRKHYRPFGEEIEQGESSKDNRIGYTGHVHDRDTGLTYMGARYYDPVLGRFMGRDPVGFVDSNPLSMNRFAYGNNSPYKFVDPDGRSPINNRQWDNFSNPNQLLDAGFGAPGLRNSDGLAFREFGAFIKSPNLSFAASKGVGGTKQLGASHGQRAGKKHTKGAIKEAKKLNALKNNGVVKCDKCDVITTPTTRRTKGSTVDPREGQGDHIRAKSRNGDGATIKDQRNIKILCAKCNNQKSNK